MQLRSLADAAILVDGLWRFAAARGMKEFRGCCSSDCDLAGERCVGDGVCGGTGTEHSSEAVGDPVASR